MQNCKAANLVNKGTKPHTVHHVSWGILGSSQVT
jgi:hypothetical protein